MVEDDVEALRGHLDTNNAFSAQFVGEVTQLLGDYGVETTPVLLANLGVTRDKTGQHADAESVRDEIRTNGQLRLEFQGLVTKLCRQHGIPVTHDLMSHLSVCNNCPHT
ncbi:MAG: hypothetical protein HOM68_11490 [Gemmatimonadetes bacterium]|nr:hypothetical protein [Gemmatimonadota bacterium]MBT4608693.1 hypothetical protein [Gemmatimonadota bacterium]MBT5057153.1 hypothetical protein [Gemmatimonadota bacterium]MBT5588186.1 hypothetical protein [Gemmatimonadota bacterium]MBT5961627.1 hypothetical protein [Gemmatimonadota bacterium]